MDKLETFKALMPFIPIRYRRPLLLFLHIDELMRIINSMNECLNTPMNVMDEKPADMSKLLEILKGNMSKDDSDMISMFLPLLMLGGDGLSSLLSGFTSGLFGSSDENKNSTDNRNTDTHNNDNYDNNTYNNNNYNNNNHNHDNDSDFSDEIDDLFKDFINETGNDYYE